MPSYHERTDREQLEYIESRWYRVAQQFRDSADPLTRLEAAQMSDILLDGWNEIVSELGGLAVDNA